MGNCGLLLRKNINEYDKKYRIIIVALFGLSEAGLSIN